MKLKLHTISPIHIGTGNSLEPFEYIIDGDTYYRLNQNKAFSLALERHPNFPEEFENWIERTDRKLKKSNNNHEQAEIREKFNFKYFCEAVLQDYELSELILEKGYAYKCSLPYGSQGKKQINELIKDHDNTPYIPGTSIKGAIRTILAWRTFSNLSDEKKKEVLLKVQNSNDFQRGRGRDLDTPLEEELFICGNKKRSRDRSGVDFSDIKFDILKFIQISDAFPQKSEMAVYPSNLYLTDKAPQTQTPALEAVELNSVFEFEIKVNESEVRKIYEASLSPNSNIWINFDKKFKNIFEFYPHETEAGKLEEKIVESIKYAVSDFYKAQIKREAKWIANFRKDILVQKRMRTNADIESIKEFYEAYEEIPRMFKIGWASGFNNTTIFDTLEKNELTRPFIEKIFEKFKIGIPQNKKKDPTIKPADVTKFPKSKRFAAEDDMIPVDPFGWVALLDIDQNLELE